MDKYCETDLKKYYDPYVGNFLVPIDDWCDKYMEDVKNILTLDRNYYFCAWSDGENEFWCLSSL